MRGLRPISPSTSTWTDILGSLAECAAVGFWDCCLINRLGNMSMHRVKVVDAMTANVKRISSMATWLKVKVQVLVLVLVLVLVPGLPFEPYSSCFLACKHCSEEGVISVAGGRELVFRVWLVMRCARYVIQTKIKF
jgi:hypothetical protein